MFDRTSQETHIVSAMIQQVNATYRFVTIIQ
jgi:hypothetical protein